MKAFLDTHVCVALYEGKGKLVGRRARDLIERSALFVSPILRLELVFLNEVGRVEPAAGLILEAVEHDLGVATSSDTIADIVEQAVHLTWTRDPFDRLLVATAQLHKAPLITKDELILKNFSGAVW